KHKLSSALRVAPRVFGFLVVVKDAGQQILQGGGRVYDLTNQACLRISRCALARLPRSFFRHGESPPSSGATSRGFLAATREWTSVRDSRRSFASVLQPWAQALSTPSAPPCGRWP